MKFKVIQEDIDEGSHDALSCPIALAINRATGSNNAFCGIKSWGFVGDIEWPLTKEMFQFLANYDHGKPVGPQEFEVKPLRYQLINSQQER